MSTTWWNRSTGSDVGNGEKLFNNAAIGRRVAGITLVGGIGGGLVFPILPALGLQLGIAGGMIGLILSANRLSRLASAPWAGRLVDRVGGKIPMSTGLLVESVGILCYYAAIRFGYPTVWFLTGRVIFGVGSALLLVGAQATMLGISTDNDRGRRMASVRIAISLGIPAGLVLGGLIADRFSNAAAFLTATVLTALGALLALQLVPGIRAQGSPSSPKSAAPKIRFLLQGLHPSELPFIGAAGAFNFLVFFSLQGVLLATLVLLISQHDFHLLGLAAKGTAGLIMALMMACSSVFAFFSGRILDRVKRRSVVIFPCLAGLAASFILLGFASKLTMILWGVALAGTVFSGINLPVLALLGDVVSPDRYGRAVALYQICGDFGGTLGPIAGMEAGLRLGLNTTYFAVATLLILSTPAALWIFRHETVRRQA